MKIYILLLFLILSLLACTTEHNEKDPRVVAEERSLKSLKEFQHTGGKIIRLWANDSLIFVSNMPEAFIYCYDYNGSLIKKIGHPGQAPWENGSIWYFALDTNKDIYWVHDYSKQMIKKQSLKNDSLIMYSKVITQNNITHIKDGKFIIPRIDDSQNDFILSLYDINQNKYIENESLATILNITKQPKIGSIFEGEIFKGKGNYALYSCNRMGVFFTIDCNNFKINSFNDIRNLPIPKIVMRNGEVHFEPKQISCFSGFCDEKYAYFLTLESNADKVSRSSTFLLDIYQIENGKYVKSVKVPNLNDEERPMRATIGNNKIIVLYENGTIVVYELTI